MSGDVSAVLRKAAEVLETDGWCQGNLSTLDGRVCAMGAVIWATHELWDGYKPGDQRRRVDVQELALDALGLRALGDGVRDSLLHPVAVWNDEPGRTMADVVKLFGQVADEEEVR